MYSNMSRLYDCHPCQQHGVVLCWCCFCCCRCCCPAKLLLVLSFLSYPRVILHEATHILYCTAVQHSLAIDWRHSRLERNVFRHYVLHPPPTTASCPHPSILPSSIPASLWQPTLNFFTEDDLDELLHSTFFIKMCDDASWLYVEDHPYTPELNWLLTLWGGYKIAPRFQGEVRRLAC